MIIKNFFYNEQKDDKKNYIKSSKKMKLIRVKNQIVYILILVIVFSLFPLTSVKAVSTYTQKLENGIEAFPESYQKLLKEFVDEKGHTNWNFQAYYTGIDWNEFISGEAVHGRNRVHNSFDTAYRCSCDNLASGYYCADSRITSYFIDPRNFINERNIFQFLDVSYNPEIYTRGIVEKMVSKYEVFNNGQPITFVMSDENHPSYNQEVTMTYTDIIMKAAEVSSMSPISMVIKIVQEVGSSGSASTDGKNEKYPNTYNFFNIGSSDSGDAILNGLSYANSKGWHCPYTSIVEGANFNSQNYIKAGQNTAYFYKYDCVGTKILNLGETQQITSDNLYHQYMTNIQDPYSQSAALFETYTNEGLLTESLNFIIPVFNNMPAAPVNKHSSLSGSDQNLYYANVTSSLLVRSTPGGSTLGKFLYKDDLVIMLQRNYDSKWDKIQLWNGQIAYTASEYLKPFVPNSDSGTGTGGENPPIDEPDTPQEPKEEIKPIANIGYGYADVSSSLNMRSGAGTSYNIINSVKAKEEFLILSETDNWYNVRLNTGLTGYVSKEYVKTMEYMKVDEENKVITVIPNIKANMVAGKIGATTYSVKKGEEEILNNSLGTGFVIKLGDKEYTIIKMGDVSGDGNITPLDYVKIKNHIMKASTLEGIYKTASDLTGDNEITPLDYVKVKNHIMGTSKITL